MEIEDITFDDVLKNGPEWGNNMLRGAIGRELKELNSRGNTLRALTSVKIREFKGSNVEDLLRLLEYDRGYV